MQERMRDAMIATNIPLSWRGAVAGYVRHGDPARVWTAQDWQRFRGRRKLPIFVRSDPGNGSEAQADAFAAVRDLYDLGVPRGKYVALDSETARDDPYRMEWARTVSWLGFRPMDYHSESTPSVRHFVFDWVAWYKGVGPFMAPRPAKITQYASGAKWDSSTVRTWAYYSPWWWK